MPDEPLPSGVVTRLKCDPIAALAAAVLIVNSFPHIVSWAINACGGLEPSRDRSSSEGPKDGAPTGEVKGNGTGRSTCRTKNGAGARARSPEPRAREAHTSREAAAKHDEALLALMRANPGARSTEIIRKNGRPRNSTVSSLKRLEEAGLVEHAGRGEWTVVDPDLLEAPAPRPPKPGVRGWVEPLSGKRSARHAADGRVRDEVTVASA